MNIKRLAYSVLASSVLAVCAVPAHATLMLTLFDGTTTKTVVDNGIGDSDATVGVISATGSLGIWFVNFTAGFSNNPGVDGLGVLSLNSTNWSRGAGSMTITLTDGIYTTPNGPTTATTSATAGCIGFPLPCGAGSNVSFSSLLNGSTVFSGGSGTGSVGVDTTGGFGLQQIATITHTGTGFQGTNFDIVTTVPEPATLGLLGLGLIGLGFVRRRKI